MATKKTARKAPAKRAPARSAKATPAKSTSSSRSSKPAAKASAKAKPPARAKAPARARKGLQLSGVGASLTVNDIQKSLAWYCDVIGFMPGEKWEVDGQLRGVELFAGESMFMIGQDDWKKGRDRKKGEGVRFYCATTQDVDKLASGIKQRGGTLDQEPTDQMWGMRDFGVTDPDGYKITIGKELKKARKR
ncbi:MAG: VOC family protein [Thermoanaerobaculia bacterium]